MATEPPPPWVTAGLSAPLLEDRPRRGLGLSGALILLLGLGLFLVNLTQTNLLDFLIAAGLVLVGGALASTLLRPHYLICPEGFLVRRWGGWNAWRWHEITAIWALGWITYHERALLPGQAFSCVVQAADGGRLKLRHLSVELLELIDREVTRAQLAGARAQLAQGGTVWFGELSLSPVGIHCGNALLPWAEAQGVRIVNDGVDVLRKGQVRPWRELSTSDVANLSALKGLVQQHTAAGGGADR
jgi:hypothetical protein